MRKKLRKLKLIRETIVDLGKVSGAGYTDAESGCWTLVGVDCGERITGHCGGNCTSRTSCESDVCLA